MLLYMQRPFPNVRLEPGVFRALRAPQKPLLQAFMANTADDRIRQAVRGPIFADAGCESLDDLIPKANTTDGRIR